MRYVIEKNMDICISSIWIGIIKKSSSKVRIVIVEKICQKVTKRFVVSVLKKE